MNTLIFEQLERAVPGFLARTSTRQGGQSRGPFESNNMGLHVGDDPAVVVSNREGWCALQGINLRDTVWLDQVHGARVEGIGLDQRGRGSKSYNDSLKECDGVVCSDQGVYPVIGHADCLAIIVVDIQKKCFGMAHAGWRGALAGVPVRLVQRLMTDFGSDPGNMMAGLSCCLGPEALEMGEEHRVALAGAWEGASRALTKSEKGHFYMDLWAYCQSQLQLLGIAADAIFRQELSTASYPELLFSHRRGAGKAGRMITLAGFHLHNPAGHLLE